MPTIETPKAHAKILITSIDIIDVKTGEILKNRDLLIQGNLIKSIDTSGIIKVPKTSFYN